MDLGRLFDFCILCLAFVFMGTVAVSPPGKQREVVECEPHEARCHDGSRCIPKDKFCDRELNCPDQSDERLCVLGNCTDQKKYFPCAQTDECVTRNFVCDGIHDCADGSDELVCDPKENCSLEHDRFLCADRKSCLLSDKVCDGHADCDDGTDESPNCDNSRKACQAGMCGEFGVCKALPHGPVCICQQGFTLLKDNVTCKDIDECNISQGRLPCDQVCTNTNGSFNCSCLPGYRLENTTHCRVQDPDPVLYVAANTGVLAYYIRSGRWVTVFEDQPDIVSLDFGPHDALFWTAVNRTSNRVQFRHIGQPGNLRTTHTLVDIGLSSPRGMAVDWMTDAVYVVSEEMGQIEACVRTSPVRCVVVREKLDKPKDIIICHHLRRMFWSSWGLAPKIALSDLDGKNAEVIVSERLRQPTGLVVDWPRKTILWADSRLHRIERSDLDGSHRQIVVSRGLHRPSSLALLEGTLYWANARDGSLSSCHLYKGCKKILHLRNDLHHPNSLVIGSSYLNGTPKDSPVNLCKNAPCSHVCLSSRHGYRCLCPSNQILTQDDHTCSTGTPGTDQLFIGTTGKILALPQRQPGYTRDLLLPTILSPSHTPNSLAVAQNTSSVVYLDSIQNTITMATTDVLTGKVTEKTLYDGVDIQHVLDLTVNWLSGNIYWATVGPKAAIMVGRTTGEHILTLVKDDLEQPNSLDVDPVNGYLYFSDIGKSPFIGRCQLDGTEFTRLITDVGCPNHLVVSLDDSRLYFVDVHYHQIVSVSLPDGADHRTHWQGITGQVLGLAVIGRWIYWTDQRPEGGALCRVNKHDHNQEMCFLRNTVLMQGLAVPSSNSSQVDGCRRNNGGCSHFCFGQESGVVCRCSDGFTLQEDGHSCQAVVDQNCVFHCRDGHCITDRSYLCDGQPDCTDGEEEDTSLCAISPTQKLVITGAVCQQPSQCHHMCRETPEGPKCDCRPGYQLSDDGKRCRDVDECENNNGGCSQLCDNKDGSNSCSCIHGYTKNASRCYALEPHPYLVIGGAGGIDKVNDQGQIEELTIGEASGFVTALDVVMETGDIIFVTSVQEALFLYTRTERIVTRLTTLGSKVTDLSYDWIGRNVYYTDGQRGILGVCGLQSRPVLCRTIRYEPVHSIALHPVIGWMLWTSSRDGTIMRMGMDGRNLTVLVEATVGQSVLALTIDYATDRIYWISSPANQVWSSDMDGRRRQNVLNGVNGRHFCSVSVFENTLYLMDKRSKVVYLYSKPGGQQTGVIQLMSTPSSLRIVHPFQQAHQMTDECRARQCSHLCLVTPKGANCYCPDGFQLLPGSDKTCKDGKTSVSSVTAAKISTPRPDTENLHKVVKIIPSLSTKNSVQESPYRLQTTSRPVPENSLLQSPYQVTTPRKSLTDLPYIPTTTPEPSNKTPQREPPYKVMTTPQQSTENPQREPPYKVMSSSRLTTNNPQSSTPSLLNLNLPKLEPAPPKVQLGVQHVEYPHSKEGSLCVMKCENGGTCVIAEDYSMQYCSCVGGYQGATCGEVDVAVQGQTTTDDTQSIIIGVTSAIAIAIIAIVIISVVCWIKHRSGRSFPDYMPCVARTSKIFTAKEDAEGLVSDTSSTFGDLRFDSDVTFREFDSVSYQTTSSTDHARCGPNNSCPAQKDQVYSPRDIYYCPSNQSFGSAFCRQEEGQDRSSSPGASSSSSL